MFKEILEKTISSEDYRNNISLSLKRLFVTCFGEYIEDASAEKILSYLRSISENTLYKIFFIAAAGEDDATEEDIGFSRLLVLMVGNHYIKMLSIDVEDLRCKTTHVLHSLIKEKQTSKSILYIKDGIIQTDLVSDNLCKFHSE